MNRKRFLSLTLSAAMVLAGSVPSPGLGAMASYQASEEETDEQETRPRVRRAQRGEVVTYESIDVANYLDHAVLAQTGTKPDPGPLPEQRTQRVCQALESYRPLYWRGTTLSPAEVRRVFSLEADSHIRCAVGNHRLSIFEDLRYRADRSGQVHTSPDNPTKEYQNDALIDRLDDATIATDGDFARVGSPLDQQDKVNICSAVKRARNLDWRGVWLSAAQVRSALSLQPNTTVACSMDDQKMTFAQRQATTPRTERGADEKIREFKPLEVVQRLWNAIKPGRGNRIRSNPRISTEHREELCRTFESHQPISWGPKDLTPAEVRTAFGIQPDSQVQCSFRDGALNLRETAPTREPSGRHYPNPNIYHRLSTRVNELNEDNSEPHKMGIGILAIVSDAEKRTVCEGLEENRSLRWMSTTLQPHDLRRAFSLQPQSSITCSYDRSGITIRETATRSHAQPSDTSPTDSYYELEAIRRTLNTLNQLQQYPNVDVENVTAWSKEKKQALCRAIENRTDLRWGSSTYLGAKLRRWFSLQPTSEVRCTYDSATLKLTEIQ